MKTFLIAAATMLVVMPAVAATTFKCTTPSGNVYHQSTPCPGGVEEKPKLQPESKSVPLTADNLRTAQDIRKKEAAEERERNMARTAALGKIQVGMPANLVRRAWGDPQKINSTITSGGRHEQWIYSNSQYVYLQNGVVTSIQTSR